MPITHFLMKNIQNRAFMLKISSLANKIFSISANNFSSESNFNYLNSTSSKNRSKYFTENVDKMLFIRFYLIVCFNFEKIKLP